MKITIGVKTVAKAFKEWAPTVMDDWNDLEERRNTLGDFLEVITCLSNVVWPLSNKDWVALNKQLGLDPEMD